MAASAITWITEKAEANLIDGKVVTGDKDSAVLLGICRRAKLFLPVQVKPKKSFFLCFVRKNVLHFLNSRLRSLAKNIKYVVTPHLATPFLGWDFNVEIGVT